MKYLKQLAGWTAVATLVAVGTMQLSAQERPGRGNFDPEQFRQRMAERLREQFGVKDDAEWKIIEDRITKVTEARREVGFGGGAGMFGAFGGRRGDGDGGDRRGGGGAGDRRGSRGGDANSEADALRQAIDNNAPAEEIKSKLAQYRASRKAKEANLAKAQEDLRKVLSVRQEATAVLFGLLP